MAAMLKLFAPSLSAQDPRRQKLIVRRAWKLSNTGEKAGAPRN